jgi:hypothetical protein
MNRSALFLLLMVLGMMPAGAEQPKSDALPKFNPMRIEIVRSGQKECEPNCAEWIAAQGDIVAETPALLRRVLKAAGSKKLPILIHSRGGRIDSAIIMGRLIRGRQLEVTVSQTVFLPCTTSGKACSDGSLAGRTGAPMSYLSYCASACTFVLAAGEKRHVPAYAGVGVHQFVNFVKYVRLMRTYLRHRALINGRSVVTGETLLRERVVASSTERVETPKKEYDEAARYFHEMGIADTINPIVQSTPHEKIHWLTAEELRSTGMMTDRLDGLALVAATSHASAIEASTATDPAPTGAGPTAGQPQLASATPAPLQTPDFAWANTTIPGGHYQGKVVITNLVFRHEERAPTIEAEISPITTAGLVPTRKLAASLKILNHDPVKNVQDQSAKPLDPLRINIAIPIFCDLQRDDMLKFTMTSYLGDAFDGETIYLGVKTFPGMSLLLQRVCDH